jgi:hypothetical protein
MPDQSYDFMSPMEGINREALLHEAAAYIDALSGRLSADGKVEPTPEGQRTRAIINDQARNG